MNEQLQEQSKNIKTTMSFAEFREFNRDLKKLKREIKKHSDSVVIATMQKQIDLITKTLKLS